MTNPITPPPHGLVASLRRMHQSFSSEKKLSTKEWDMLIKEADRVQNGHPPSAGDIAKVMSEPVPVIERWPGPEDCNAEGGCWWFYPHPDGAWHFDYCYERNYTHWLPASALPIPEANPLPSAPSSIRQIK